MSKTWNYVLNYIKTELPQQIIELSDKEIINVIKTKTLPVFSQYFPAKEKYIIDETYLCNESTGSFRIPIDDPGRIIDIYDVYLNISGGGAISTKDQVIDSLLGGWLSKIDNVTSSAPLPYLDPTNPGCITFGQNLSYISQYLPMTVILKVLHKDLNTIPTEYFYRFFLPLAAADVKLTLAKARMKYGMLNTPIGQINLNVDALIQEAQQERQEIIQRMDSISNSFGFLSD